MKGRCLKLNEVFMVDETRKVDHTRDDRMRDMSKEPVRPRPKETEFDKALEKSRMSQQLMPQTQPQSKTATEEAIREVFKREDRRGDDQRQGDKDEEKDGRDSRQKSDRPQGKIAEQKVIAKGKMTRQGSGSGGGREGGGYGASGSKRDFDRLSMKLEARSIPIDLQGKFAQKLAQTMKGTHGAHLILSQQILNKIVQYVRIGINEKGEKEMQLDLHERIFRGLKLRVVARAGKVAVYFRTSDANGRAVFKKNSDAIRATLSKKGIEVDEIVVS